MKTVIAVLCAAALAGSAWAETAPQPRPDHSPVVLPERAKSAPRARQGSVPRSRWEFHRDGRLWSRAALSALRAHGAPMLEVVPNDIASWCPAYPDHGPDKRAEFWVGLMSALAKHESTWRPTAVGGGGKWYGLLQILPSTARGYGCRARSGAALKNPTENLSCAIRIMAVTVPRDNAVALKGGRTAGVAADWGPMVWRAKRAEMSAWTRKQTYCRLLSSVKPKARPNLPVVSTKDP